MKKKSSLSLVNFPPMGLLYIASSLQSEGHNTRIIEYHAEKDPISKIQKYLQRTDVIGISVSSYSLDHANRVARAIHDFEPSIPIVIGGPHPTFVPKQSLIDIPNADISVCGDGEQVIKEIASYFEGKQDISSIPGIHYYVGNRIVSNDEPVIIPDLDMISFPLREVVDEYQDNFYTNNSSLFQPKLASIVTSRGCPFNCRFCARCHYYRVFRQRSAENVINEIDNLGENYHSLIIVDENFITDIKRANKIADSLIRMNLDMDIMIQGTRVDTAEKNLYKKLKRAGVKTISFGIESGNQEILDFYYKGINVHQIINAVNLAHTTGFITMGNFILGAPGENKYQMKKTIDFACKLPLDFVFFWPLGYYYGSKLWEEAVKQKKIQPSDNCYYISPDVEQNGLINFKDTEIKSMCNIGYNKFYFNPRYIFREIINALRKQDFKILKTELRYLLG